MNVWNKIERRVCRLRQKYPNSGRKAMARLGIWAFRSLLKPRRFFLDESKIAIRSTADARADGRLKIFFFLRGGVGDVAIASTYLKELYKRVDCENCVFCVAPTQNLSATRSIFRGFSFVEVVDLIENCEFDARYAQSVDAMVDLIRFPVLTAENRETVALFSPRLREYFETLEKFKDERKKLAISSSMNLDYLKIAYSLAFGQTRRSQPDVDGILGLSDETRAAATLDESGFELLRVNGLLDRLYITTQRGVDETFQSAVNVRVWPKRYYEELIKTIKTNFPSIVVVQLGKASEKSDLRGVDVDLRGRTSFDELKCVLKYSALHLDGECGMVHFNHLVNGRSAVFFGQTNVDFCGYPENINVKVPGICPVSCEWIVDDWQDRCMRGFDEPPCMTALTPALFFDAIRPTLAAAVERPVFEWRREENASVDVLLKSIETNKTVKTIVAIGAFDEAEVDALRRPGVEFFHFSTNLTTAQIAAAKARGFVADWADVLNVPLTNESCDLVVCDVDAPSEFARRELVRITRVGGAAIFGRVGGIWRKTCVENRQNQQNQ